MIPAGDPPGAWRNLPCPAAPLSLDRHRRPGGSGAMARRLTGLVSVYTSRPSTASREGAVAIESNISELNPLGQLLAATAGGDRGAFQQVYQLSGPRLFAIALRILRRRELAEEVLQEAFVSIWRKPGQYQPERGEPLAWMARIVRNRAIDHIRAESRAPQDQTSLDKIPEARLEAEGAVAFADHGTGALRDCLGHLKKDQRNSIVLAYYYGLTHEELAARLETPLGTVKSWVRRGLMQLKDCLDQ